MSLSQRLKLNGKSATKEEIAQEVARLMKGDKTHNIPAKNVTQIAAELSLTRQSIYNYIELAKELNFLVLDEKGEPITELERPKLAMWEKYGKKHPITDDLLVQKWRADMENRKGGVGLSNTSQFITWLENFCNTLRLEPQDLLISKEKTAEYGWNFMTLYKEGKAIQQKEYNPEVVDIKNIRYSYSKMTRDFMAFHNFSFRKGESGWFDQRVVNLGKYATIKLTEEEFAMAEKYLIEKFGVDSDEYRYFWVGVETCARKEALIGMKLEYVVHVSPKTQQKTYLMSAFESKTKHIKEGIWTKYIKRKNTQESIDAYKQRGGIYLYDTEKYPTGRKFDEHFRDAMLSLYEHLGKITNRKELEEKRAKGWKKVGNYWFDHWTHVLRHVGAHYWLEKTGWNLSVVAKIGGWTTTVELERSYGEMPPDLLMKIIDGEFKPLQGALA